jgi:hypothetical protein
VTSASSDVDFDDYWVFGYQLEPEYTEEELRQNDKQKKGKEINIFKSLARSGQRF